MFYVIANDAYSETRNAAAILESAGYPVWSCDGTADDVQIQAAIDAAEAVGGKVLLIGQVFYTNATLNIDTSNIQLEGERTASRQTTTPIIKSTSCPEVVLQ